ncbi:hypothetical protein Bsp3421_000137 (plasmid) [Burkholderia sp. FERM BP-3421]|uniref:hypothetical protein n=1 Tax=Burkholderia sp. FERM BP-3421 TaxID=1494466 RepID=UPI0023601360|nr:hypothetical protein [Burkholderia sp. FERM BP-3421]WDD90312.1 hypothetical protein Bsp3421_000137 [Burkholderia sp. FERM BP-3421]
MNYDAIRHARLLISSQSRMIPLDQHDQDWIAWFIMGLDTELDAVQKGLATVRDADGHTPHDRINGRFFGAYLSLHDAELHELVHTQWLLLRDKGALP